MRKSSFLSICLMLSFLCACAIPPDPVCEKEDRAYCRPDGNFTGRWYDHYERALSCMEGECYPAALADLDESIRHRPRDQRMARTFGMHFTDYFPHREKGLIHYLTGDYDAARSELELSIEQYPSAKAFFYLDKVRKQLMEQGRKDISLPRLSIESPLPLPDETWTNADPVVISGKVEDEQYVSEIILNNRPVFMEASGQAVDFEQKLTLEQGRHEIGITARNLRGGETAQTLVIHVDRLGPVIILSEASPSEIKGHLCDESGDISLSADGKDVPLPKGKKVPFSVSVRDKAEAIRLVAVDSLGNETEAVVSASSPPLKGGRGDVSPRTDTPPRPPQGGMFGFRISDFGFRSFPSQGGILISPPLKGVRGMFRQVAGRRSQVAADFGFRIPDLPPVLIAASDVVTDTDRMIPAPENKDAQTGPRIVLDGWPETEVTAFVESLHLKGRVGSSVSIKEVSLNDTPLSRDSGNVIFFNHFVRLKEGENRLVIRARDELGNTGVRKLTITRRIPRVFRPEQRYCLAMRPFESLATEKGEQEDRHLFQHFLLKQLTDGKRFQIMVRDEAGKVFHESGRPDVGTAGPTTSPDAALLGGMYATNNGIEIAARVVDIDSGEILAIEDAYSESEGRAALEDMAEKLSEKFHRAFPLMDALVERVQDRFPLIRPESWMPEKKVMRRRWPLIVYKHADSGNPLGSESEILGEARIDSITARYYRVVPEGTWESKIKEGHRMISR